jgi:hypothetical protein
MLKINVISLGFYSEGLLMSMIDAQHFPLETLYKRGRFKVDDFRKKDSDIRAISDPPRSLTTGY